MTFMYEGKKIFESEFSTVICNQMTDDMYEDMLDERYPLVELEGMKYSVGFLLRRADYEYFKELRNEECEHIARYIIEDPEEGLPYGITWEEDE